MLKGTLLSIGVIALAVLAVNRTGQGKSATPAQEPQFTADGQLIPPKDYREWIFLSSGLGMTYGPIGAGATESEPRFDNVFVNPPAYRSFLKTGTWPDKTIFVLEVRSSGSKASINKNGHFQTEIAGLQAEVKDSKRFPAKWAFFGVNKDGAPAKAIPSSASCYTCHPQNGAVDNTFVQFYPTLINVAREHGTLREKAGE
jgi:hypothetical protein